MVRTRIAPTPSGYLHIGNAVNFALIWLWARRDNGIVRLRIDDLDAARTRPEYLYDIFKTLEWLGLDWDEGPQTPDEHEKIYSQSLRTEKYAAVIEQLIQSGQAFACSCSRKEIKGQDICNCRKKGLQLNRPDTSLRIHTPENLIITIHDAQQGAVNVTLNEVMRDFVIRRRDGIAAYQVVSLADDVEFNTNLIIRGGDLLFSTAAQLHLAKLLGNNLFAKAIFYHHPLLKDGQGLKLSKSTGSNSLQAWRQSGKTPEDFYRLLSRVLNRNEEAATLSEMLQGAKQGLSLMGNF